ncbi:MAG: calycin-like domain-containing protein [Prevotellaceae bacterium]|nr:calycin-like domain-containing protein [Prevotella sp.]MDD7531056.1 calycin-like domain-containing protein [Prevotellaceae bacterium]MDY2634188.1 calycin-like domain-containing protein [Prevotella sp.]
MKKLFTLAVIAIMNFPLLHAQSVRINKADGTSLSFKASEIRNIEYLPATETADTTVLHRFTGYITVSSKQFTDTYFGDSARIEVLEVNKKYFCRFHDGLWGDGEFEVTMNKGAVSGTGRMKLTRQGKTGEYDASLEGAMTAFSISIPEVMGGTVIKWTYGEVPPALKASGTYAGSNSMVIGGIMGPYEDADCKYTITANADGTVNLTAGEEQYGNTPMGDIVLGGYTVSNIAYDAETKTFGRKYGSDGLQVHFKCISNGEVTKESDYAFQPDSKVVISMEEEGKIKIVNSFTIGKMPFGIVATFQGNKK